MAGFANVGLVLENTQVHALGDRCRTQRAQQDSEPGDITVTNSAMIHGADSSTGRLGWTRNILTTRVTPHRHGASVPSGLGRGLGLGCPANGTIHSVPALGGRFAGFALFGGGVSLGPPVAAGGKPAYLQDHGRIHRI